MEQKKMKLKTKNRRHLIDTISISHFSSLQAFKKYSPLLFSHQLFLNFLPDSTKIRTMNCTCCQLFFTNLFEFRYSNLKYIKFTLNAHNFPCSRTIDTIFFLKFPPFPEKFSRFSIDYPTLGKIH